MSLGGLALCAADKGFNVRIFGLAHVLRLNAYWHFFSPIAPLHMVLRILEDLIATEGLMKNFKTEPSLLVSEWASLCTFT
jgi:hypothetical protein